MKRAPRRKSPQAAEHEEVNLVSLINKIEIQINSLEKKIDSLISQGPEKRPREEHFSKPFHGFDRFNRHDHRDRPRHDSGRRDRPLTRVICADCSKECEVPFKPSNDRPVYCKDCFAKRKDRLSFNNNRDNRPKDRSFSHHESAFDKFKHGEEGHKYGKKKRSDRPRKRK